MIKYPQINKEKNTSDALSRVNKGIKKIENMIKRYINKCLNSRVIKKFLTKVKYYHSNNEIFIGISYILIAPIIFKILMILYTLIMGNNIMAYISILTISLLIYVKGVSILLFNEKINVLGSRKGKSLK